MTALYFFSPRTHAMRPYIYKLCNLNCIYITTPAFGHPLEASPPFPLRSAKPKQALSLHSLNRQP